MKLFDLHCDTLTELYDKGEDFERSSCRIAERHYIKFSKYAQVCAVFSKTALDDDGCFERFFNIVNSFENRGVSFCADSHSVSEALKKGTPAFILSVEDGRLLSNDLPRLKALRARGVRILTPLWSGVTCIGGAFDTDEGLSDFGMSAVEECFILGIIPDISHASEKSAGQIISLAARRKRPVIASHSNSYSVFPHPRNLRDEAALDIKRSGGVIGISFAPQHLSNGNVSSETVFSHIEHYLSLLGEDSICIGADFDGTDSTPSDITCQGDMGNLYNTMLKHNYPESLADKLFFENAMRFFNENL